MTNQKDTVARSLKSSHIILPVAIGLLAIAWMFQSEFSTLTDAKTDLSSYFDIQTVLFLFLAFLLACFKDLCSMWRLYLLSDKQLRFPSLFRVRMLYEFTSAVTPSAAGGSALEMLFIHKEGLKFGESTAITIISLFLDELFFVLAFPLFLLFVPFNELFAVSGRVSASIISLFMIGYVFKTVWVLLLFTGIFIKPSVITGMFRKIFAFKFLRKYRVRAYRTAIDIRECSKRMRHKSFQFWLSTIGLSFAMWLSRFSIVNMLIMGFVPLSENLLVIGRQFVIMVVMLIAPTPGGSGFVELMFNNYLGEFIPSGIIALLIVVFWRLLTYYNYLLAGIIIAPRWVSRNFGKKK